MDLKFKSNESEDRAPDVLRGPLLAVELVMVQNVLELGLASLNDEVDLVPDELG